MHRITALFRLVIRGGFRSRNPRRTSISSVGLRLAPHIRLTWALNPSDAFPYFYVLRQAVLLSPVLSTLVRAAVVVGVGVVLLAGCGSSPTGDGAGTPTPRAQASTPAAKAATPEVQETTPAAPTYHGGRGIRGGCALHQVRRRDFRWWTGRVGLRTLQALRDV